MRLLLIVLVTCLLPTTLEAQVAVDISRAPDWIEGLKDSSIPGWIYLSDGDLSALRASSSLQKFLPSSATDGKPSTAWAEGGNGAGIGEVLVVDFDPETRNWWIWSGYGKSSELFLGTNRPKKIKIFLIGTYCYECTPTYCLQGNFSVLNSIDAELLDVNEFQKLPVPEIRLLDNSADCQNVGGHKKNEHYLYKLAIQIQSVYPGSQYSDTCISEIMSHSDYIKWLRNPRR